MSKFVFSNICSVCGNYRTSNTNHDACSRKLQEKFAGEKRKPAKRKLNPIHSDKYFKSYT